MKKILFALLVFVIIAIAGGWYFFLTKEEHVTWRTQPIVKGTISDTTTANGTLNPEQLVNVGTQVSGQVSHIYVKVNDKVKKGELLAEIDPSILQTQLQQSQSGMETARLSYEQSGRDLERTRMLLAKDYIAKVDLEHAEEAYLTAKNNYDSSKSSVERDKVNLNYTKIYSPIDGMVLSQDVKLGETLAASYQTPKLFTIAGDLTKMKIEVNFGQSSIVQIKPGLPVTFSVDAFPDKQFPAQVMSVNYNPNTQSGTPTYTVIINVDNKDKQLFPGMNAYVSITLNEKDDVLTVPAAALRFTPPESLKSSGLQRIFKSGSGNSGQSSEAGGRSIYILRDGALVEVPVYVGVTDDKNVEISGEGVAEGDQVVLGLARKAR